MKDKNQVALNEVAVEFHVPNFAIVKRFYSKLGFKVVWEYPPKKRSGYLVMRRGNSILGVYCGNGEVYKHSFFSRFPRNTPRSYGVEIGIYVCDKDIVKFYGETVKKIGKKSVVKPLTLQPWGKWDFRIVDPFGFYLRFSEPLNILKKPVKSA